MRQRLAAACVLVSGVAGGGLAASAQTHVVKKAENVVRAVGVYEWTGELGHPTASRFVPVTVFIDGQLQDGGLYLARPVPFALDVGTVFEVDKAGVPDGTLELAYARHYLANGVPAVDDGWLGYGAYKAPPVVKVTKLKAGPISPVIVNGGSGDQQVAKDTGRPTLTNKSGSGSAGTDAGRSDPAKSDPGKDDPDRPTMTRRPGSESTAASDSGKDPAGSGKDATGTSADGKDPKPSTDATSSSSENDPERPTLRKRTEEQRVAARKQSNSSSVTSVGNINDDPDRPNLHRGKPVSRMDEDELPPLKGIPPGMQQMVAVSDAKNRPQHDFTREFADESERLEVLGKMQAMARGQLASYNEGLAKVTGQSAPVNAAPAKPVAGQTAAARAAARRKAAAAKSSAPLPAPLTGETLKGFTLSYGGAATYVYTASSAGADGVARYVTVVAQREPNGELKMALSNVTDAQHLDRTPWMRLVDAVDVEASNRASLLMELRGQNSRQFALYRVIGAEAEQRFVTETP